jgi:hypothetical protein
MGAVRIILVLGLGALLGAGVAIAVQRARAPHEQAKVAEAARCDGEAPPATDTASPDAPQPARHEPAAAARTGTDASRYTVCAREETPAQLSRVALLRDRRDLWSLHCGATIHLIAIEELGGELVPQRAALLQIQSPSPAESSVAVATYAADLDADGRPDWVAPVLLVDAGGTPRGGALHKLAQRPHGGFAPPSRLLNAAPLAIAVGALDAEPTHDLALLHRQNAGTGQADELWLVAGGPAIARFAKRPALVSTLGVAALDLDLDGKDDVAVGSAQEERVRLWLSSRGALAQVDPVDLTVTGVQQLLAADLGDRSRALVLVAGQLQVLRPRAGGPAEPEPIACSEGLRDVHTADADGDRELDLVGYAHPEVVALSPAAAAEPTRKSIAALRGDASVLYARVAQLDRDPRPDLVLVVVSPNGEQLELALARNLDPPTTVRLASTATPVADAALLERFSVH